MASSLHHVAVGQILAEDFRKNIPSQESNFTMDEVSQPDPSLNVNKETMSVEAQKEADDWAQKTSKVKRIDYDGDKIVHFSVYINSLVHDHLASVVATGALILQFVPEEVVSKAIIAQFMELPIESTTMQTYHLESWEKEGDMLIREDDNDVTVNGTVKEVFCWKEGEPETHEWSKASFNFFFAKARTGRKAYCQTGRFPIL